MAISRDLVPSHSGAHRRKSQPVTTHILQSHSELIRKREAGSTMPGALYGREDVFNTDVEVFFHKHWISPKR